jgi:hypothetical protein
LFSASARDGDRMRWLGYWSRAGQAERAIDRFEELLERAPHSPRPGRRYVADAGRCGPGTRRGEAAVVMSSRRGHIVDLS